MQEESRITVNEMVVWHHGLNGHKFDSVQEMVNDRDAWHAAVHGVCKESDMTERLNNNKKRREI